MRTRRAAWRLPNPRASCGASTDALHVLCVLTCVVRLPLHYPARDRTRPAVGAATDGPCMTNVAHAACCSRAHEQAPSRTWQPGPSLRPAAARPAAGAVGRPRRRWASSPRPPPRRPLRPSPARRVPHPHHATHLPGPPLPGARTGASRWTAAEHFAQVRRRLDVSTNRRQLRMAVLTAPREMSPSYSSSLSTDTRSGDGYDDRHLRRDDLRAAAGARIQPEPAPR